MKAIFAVDEGYGFGKGNKLPWNLPQELDHFKNITTCGVLIMGHRTWCSVPQALLCRNRVCIIVSRTVKQAKHGALCVSSLEDAVRAASLYNAPSFLIGGCTILKEAFAKGIVDSACVSYVIGKHSADVYAYELVRLVEETMCVESVHTQDGFVVKEYVKPPSSLELSCETHNQ